MNLFKSGQQAPVEEPLKDRPDECVACRRSGIPMVASSLPGFGLVPLCANAADCHRHWPAEPPRQEA